MFLHELKLEDQAEIENICCENDARIRLNELGLRAGKSIRVIQKTPLSGPMIIEIDNTLIALRNEEAKCIQLKK